MNITLLVPVLIVVGLLLICNLLLIIHMCSFYFKSVKTLQLVTEAIDKLTQAQKSCLLYLNNIQERLVDDNG